MEDYKLISSIGFNPLIEWSKFGIDYQLRKEIELSLFWKTNISIGDIAAANQRYYEYAYKNTRIKNCEECQIPLEYYSATYISHILSRKGYPELAHDLRNFNLLCPRCHKQWETDYSGMKIRKKNKIAITLMLTDIRK